MNNVLNYFPEKLKKILEEVIIKENLVLEEIRVRVGKPIILKFNGKEKVIKYQVSSEEILEILGLICENSIYTYQKQISEGFITISGGHRVGITGYCVVKNGEVININYINSLNFRISRQLYSCSNQVLDYILDIENNTVENTIIISPPGCRENYNFKGYS